ncbi:hypothetical protein DY000_02019121 [Brassica cretica]|uniref:RNase H type-1 domain-containing protein n=1 Tax=Brassica cretica TaxID=69181 RepID=A0ABQ7CNQ4_BRACR|nr:hypothetical protein DY000_02019121 [Brassica cretica]
MHFEWSSKHGLATADGEYHKPPLRTSTSIFFRHHRLQNRCGLGQGIALRRNCIIEDISRSLDSRGALVHHNVTSPLAAKALAMRAALQTESFLNVTHLRMFFDNQTLIRAINDKFFEKEIYGILKYIESSSSLFV